MTLLIFILTLVVAMCGEWIAAYYGWLMPLMAICAFYFTMRWGFWRCLLPLVATTAVLDATWGHSCPSRTLGVLMVMAVSAAWKRYGDLYSWPSLLGAALGIGVISAVASLLSSTVEPTWLEWRLLWQAASAIVLTPVMVVSLNHLLVRRLRWLAGALPEDGVDDWT